MEIFGITVFEGIGPFSVVALILAYLLAFVIKGMFSYGAVPPMILMGALVMPPHQAVIVAGLVNFSSQWLLLPEGLKNAHRPIAWRMIIFIIPALAVGVFVFRELPSGPLQFTVGLLLLLMLLAEFSSLRDKIEPIAHRNVAIFSAVSSMIAGVLAGIVGAGAMIFLSVLLRSLLPEKATFRGTVILIMTFMLVFRTFLLAVTGMIAWADVIIAAMLLPVAGVGLPIGRALSQSMSNDTYFTSYRWLMIFAALLLMARAL